LGKDSSLTGRTEIWEAVQSSIGRRAFLGYGYAAFWLPDTREVQYIWSEVGWHTPTAHSGYLEIVLQFGVFGEILLSVLITFSIIRIVIGFIRNNLAISAWVLMFLVTQAIVDRTESGLFSPDLRLVFWVVGILALVDRRKSQAFPAVAHFRCGAPAKFRHP
jgi:O-antigen ligase